MDNYGILFYFTHLILQSSWLVIKSEYDSVFAIVAYELMTVLTLYDSCHARFISAIISSKITLKLVTNF